MPWKGNPRLRTGDSASELPVSPVLVQFTIDVSSETTEQSKVRSALGRWAERRARKKALRLLVSSIRWERDWPAIEERGGWGCGCEAEIGLGGFHCSRREEKRRVRLRRRLEMGEFLEGHSFFFFFFPSKPPFPGAHISPFKIYCVFPSEHICMPTLLLSSPSLSPIEFPNPSLPSQN